MNNHSELLNREQTAKVLGISPQTLAVWATTKRYNLPFVKVGRAVRYRRDDIDQWLSDRTVRSEAAK